MKKLICYCNDSGEIFGDYLLDYQGNGLKEDWNNEMNFLIL